MNAGRNYSVNLKGFMPWAKDVMRKHRFKQIRAAFRPKSDRSTIGDKCHQLQYIINRFNYHIRKTFIHGHALSFDEGGHACCSRLCAVRQYNKDKPDKYRVDFLSYQMLQNISYAI